MTYDEFGRTIAANGNSHANLIIGSEQSSVTYDWADNPLTTTRSHQAFNQSQFIVDRFTYDHVGRLENVYQRVNGGAEEWMSNQDYSVKDELITKNLGGVGNSFLQAVNYTYKPNGFLTHINKDMSADDLFQFEINYETGNTTLAAVGQKNGNISQLTWQVKGEEKQTYGYQYDFLNRLSVANYGVYNPSLSPNNHYGTLYTYDSRGNIKSLQRQGFLPDNTFAQIDNLNYNYVANGSTSNRLLSIADNAPSAAKTEGFKPGVGGTYGYDANGNMNYDPHKDMNIRYNYLNLPEFIEFPDCKAIEYSYDASGTKLKKTTKNGGAVISTQDYIGGIEYKNGVIEAIYNAEGRLYFENGTSRYEYNLTDHLGNNRVTFSDINGNGVIEEGTELLQENHYYPFGLAMKGNWLKNEGRENKYLYNGKELNDDFGLGWLDYGARWFDPAIARWNSVDPLSELQAAFSPYHYTYNNPISFNDPTGMYGEDPGESTSYETFQGYASIGEGGYITGTTEGEEENGGGDPSLAAQFPALFGQIGYNGLGGGGEESSIWTRIGGGLQIAGGVIEVLGGAAIGFTGLAALAGVPIALHGVDNFQAGGRALWTGRKTRTATSHGLEYSGMSQNQAEWIDLGLSFASGAGGLMGASTKIVGTAQATGTRGHAFFSRIIAYRYALDPRVERVTLDLGYKKLLQGGTFRWGPRPDIGVLYKSNRVRSVEVGSKTDNLNALIDRNNRFMNRNKINGNTSVNTWARFINRFWPK